MGELQAERASVLMVCATPADPLALLAVLEELDLELVEAHSGQEALDKVAVQSPPFWSTSGYPITIDPNPLPGGPLTGSSDDQGGLFAGRAGLLREAPDGRRSAGQGGGFATLFEQAERARPARVRCDAGC